MNLKNKKISMLLSLALAFMLSLTCVFTSPVTGYAAEGTERIGLNRFVSDFDSKSEVYADGNSVHRSIIAEGTILLKNEAGALPLKAGARVSMFGKGSIYPGYSCGSILKNALTKSGFVLNPALTEFYTDNNRSPNTRGTIKGNVTISGYATGETPVSTLIGDSANIPSTYKDYADAAIVVIAREVGEGHDNPRTMAWSNNSITDWGTNGEMQKVVGARSMDDHYMQLDQNETDLLAHVCENFDKVIVLINAGSEIETGFLDDPNHYAYHEEIKAALWVGNYGWGSDSATQAIGSILKGDISPSGRTTDTWARDYKLDPVWSNLGNNLVADGNRYTNLATEHDYYNRYVVYKEGIYVGYRYYETRGYTEGAGAYTSAAGEVHGTTTTAWDNWYQSRVSYPFGYGLSYTTFEQEIVDKSYAAGANLDKDGTITFKVKVTNTGSVAGKEVVQLYYTSPYTTGGIEKAHVVLGAFEKTKELKPNESQILTLGLKVRDMASYDYSDANNNGFKGYELDTGDYVVRLMKNAHEEIESVTYTIGENYQYKTDEATGNTVENRFDRVSNYLVNDTKEENGNYYMSRADFEGTFPKTAIGEAAPQWVINESNEWRVVGGVTNRDTAADESEDYYTATKPTTGANNGLVLDDMFGVDYDDDKWELFLDQLTEEELYRLTTEGSYWTGIDIERLGVQRVDSEDCPIEFHPVGSSPNSPVGQAYNNYGGESLLAATWNKEIAYKKGRSFANNALWGNGKEYSKIGAWYAPAVNIHRSPFSGRNYEYYSEDSLLTGLMSAEVVKGASDLGLITYVKHFALNEQETNRLGVMTWANEQSMRELYFKPFEICVKEGKTLGIMSSLNRIGATWAGGSSELLNDVLRNEWGFKGTVVTDSFIGNMSNADQMIRAGGNLALGTAKLNYNCTVDNAGKITMTATTASLLRESAHGILYTLANSMALNFGSHPVVPAVFEEFEIPTPDVGVIGSKFRFDVATAIINAEAYPNGNADDVVYTLAEDSAPLPQGLELLATGEITGIPEEECVNYTIKVKASYGAGSATAEVVLNIVGSHGAIVYKPQSRTLKTGKINERYRVSVASASIYVPDATEEEIAALPEVTYSIANGSLLPSGLTLSKDGVIDGTPDKGCKNYAFTVVASAEGFFDVEFEYELSVLTDMSFIGDVLPDGKYGVSYFAKVRQADCDNTVTYSLKEGEELPRGLTLTSSGYIVGKPTQTVTDYRFTVIAQAEFATAVEADYYISVGLSFDVVELEKATVGKYYSGSVDMAVGSGDVYYYLKKGSLPAGMELNDLGELTGTPTKAGEYTFTVIAEADGVLSDEITLTLRVAGDSAAAGTTLSVTEVVSVSAQIATFVVAAVALVLLALILKGGNGGNGGNGGSGGKKNNEKQPDLGGEEGGDTASFAVIKEQKKRLVRKKKGFFTKIFGGIKVLFTEKLFKKAEKKEEVVESAKGVRYEGNKNRPFVVWSIITASVTLLIFVCTIVLVSVPFLYYTVCSVLSGGERVLLSGNPAEYVYYSSDYADKKESLAAANALNEQIVAEGAVLLKNEGEALPLGEGSKITVFGKNSVNLVLGGSGSNAGASANVAVNINETLRSSGFVCNEVIEGFYKNDSASGAKRPENPSIGSILTGFPTAESAVSKYTQDVKNSYLEYSDAAVVVISRVCGEGYDLPRTMFYNGSSYTSWSTKEADRKLIPGARSVDDHYLQLDQNEADMLKEAANNFDKVIVVINSASPLELGFLDDPSHYAYSANIKAALLVGTPGATGASAIGKILKGEVNPSGRTADTFARNLKNDPTWYNFGNNNQNEGNSYYYNDKTTKMYFVEYREGIYTGYRYYETKGYEAGESWYKSNVVYPFGYGLSYTSFTRSTTASLASGSPLTSDGKLTFTVEVENVGDYDGKEVVELYYSSPYTSGGIEKAHVNLGDFAKTQTLTKNGGKGTVTLELSVRDMASYDYNDANKNGFKGYELEAGEYTIYIASNAHGYADGAEAYTYTVPEGGFRYEKEENETKIENLFDDVSYHIAEYLSRKNNFENYDVLKGVTEKTYRTADASFIDSLTYKINDKEGDAWYSATAPEQAKKELSYNQTDVKLYDLIGKSYDDALWDELMSQLTVSQMVSLISTGNFRTLAIENIDKPLTTDCDGPMGFSLFMGDSSVYDTCYYASETVLAQTFNKELAYEMGKMVGNEGVLGNQAGDGSPYSGWYAPAVNVHRSQFGGRNFEYYSEDPLLSAQMAKGVVKGANEKGVYTFVKHFALNEQETNRDNTGLITWANEQTMREIYFEPFEVAVKDGGATAMMSSFNRIGKTWAGGSYALLTSLLREEWGFKGTVITDYNLKPYMDADQMIRAGGDLNLSGGKSPTSQTTATDVTQIRRAAKNVLYTIANSCAMNGHGANVVWGYTTPPFVIALIAINAALFAITAVMVGLTIYKIKKEKILTEG